MLFDRMMGGIWCEVLFFCLGENDDSFFDMVLWVLYLDIDNFLFF